MDNSVVITSAVRTAVGSLGKSLKNISGDNLGSSVISESISKSKIKAKFPNARILEIIPSNINEVVEHYLNTVAKFPAYLKLADFRPDYLTPYAKELENNKDATIRDLFDGTDEQYKKYVHKTIKNLVELRKND